jgi:hypothetical protein
MAAGITTADADGIYATPSIERCEIFRGCSGYAAGSVTVPASDEINGFNVFLRCGAPDAWWTCGAVTGHGYLLHGGSVTLRDTSDPRLTGPVTGTLSDGAPGAQATLGFAATDAGSGLYRVRVRVDDEVVADRAVGGCADLGAYAFAAPAPCERSATPAMTFDTSGWPEGHRRLHVVVEDAGGNTMLLVDRDVTL